MPHAPSASPTACNKGSTSMAPTASNPRLAIRAIAPADAPFAAELSGQLGYNTTAEEMRQRIAALPPLRDHHIALVGCLDGEVVGWIEAEVMHHLQSAPHTL